MYGLAEEIERLAFACACISDVLLNSYSSECHPKYRIMHVGRAVEWMVEWIQVVCTACAE